MPNPEMKTLTVGENTFDIRDDRIGDLADLDTTDKSSVVAAINEAAQGGGGTTDYTDLTNKPSINSVTLSGNKTAADLSLASASDVAAKITAPSSPATGAFLAWDGSAWAAQTLWAEQTVATDGAVTQALDPYVIYHFTGDLTALTITLNAAASGQIAHYHFDFDCGSTAPTVTIPNTVTMPDSNSFDANKHYEVDILNNYGAVLSWANS